MKPLRAASVVGLVILAACGTEKRLTPQEYYSEASEAFADENYPVAIKQYNELLDQYPFDEHAEEAELRIAESHYHREAYPEAIAAFNDFQRMHPMSPHLPRVYYLLGESYRDQMSTTDRDQSAAENAHGWYRVVIDRYPDNRYAVKARKKVVECRESLAGHELYVAKYYFDRDNLPAAENRVKGLLESYPDTETATLALERMAEVYADTGDEERAARVRAALAARAEQPAADGTLTLDSEPGRELLADLNARFGETERLADMTAGPALHDPTQTAAPVVLPDPDAIPATGDPSFGGGPDAGYGPGQRNVPY
jgi:outer membrane protein assembly factor BamD